MPPSRFATSLLALYSVMIGVTVAFPFELIPAHFVGFDHPNVIQHSGLMHGASVHHHHHIGMIPSSLDRANQHEPTMNSFGQRTAPTNYPMLAHNVHHPSIMQFNQHQHHQQQHPQAHHLVPHHSHSHPHQHQQNVAMNNNNFVQQRYESSQFQPYYNRHSNEDTSSIHHIEHPHVGSHQQQLSARHSPSLKHTKEQELAEARDDHHEDDDKEYQHHQGEEHQNEEPKKEENQHARHDHHKQPEIEKKHDHEESHHHHHHHVPEAIEVHHKKGGKSFQYFHQHHS